METGNEVGRERVGPRLVIRPGPITWERGWERETANETERDRLGMGLGGRPGNKAGRESLGTRLVGRVWEIGRKEKLGMWLGWKPQE